MVSFVQDGKLRVELYIDRQALRLQISYLLNLLLLVRACAIIHLCVPGGPRQELARREGWQEMDTVQSAALSTAERNIPPFRPGDTLRVHVKVIEGKRERVQVFEGTCIRRRGSGLNQTFTVRRISYGVGVERTFPLFSPRIEKIEVVRRGKARRARLYYLRERLGKAAKVKEKK